MSRYEEIMAIIQEESKNIKPKQHHRDIEHNLQVACVRWFRLQHNELDCLLFAIPNGGRRDKTTAGKLKAEGVVAGVADLFLSVPKMKNEQCVSHGLYIEMKTNEKSSRQRESQKHFESMVTFMKYDYVICRTLDEFINKVSNYLQR